jgi:hypothetical protein
LHLITFSTSILKNNWCVSYLGGDVKFPFFPGFCWRWPGGDLAFRLCASQGSCDPASLWSNSNSRFSVGFEEM